MSKKIIFAVLLLCGCTNPPSGITTTNIGLLLSENSCSFYEGLKGGDYAMVVLDEYCAPVWTLTRDGDLFSKNFLRAGNRAQFKSVSQAIWKSSGVEKLRKKQ